MKTRIRINHTRKKMEIIIPFRWTDKRNDLFERIKFPYLDSEFPIDFVGLTISDDGSPLEISEELEILCKSLGVNYIYTYSEYSPVCMSRARNNAVVKVDSDFIFFQDADLLPYKGFYNEVLAEIYAQNIEKDSANFLMFGVVYLSKDATQEFFNTPENFRKNLFLNYFLEDDSNKIEKFSTGTSVTVFHRHYYLSRGGYDEDFVEWGYEDLEFNLRCIRALRKFSLPENFLKDIGTFRNIHRYEGWKSIYRLFGDLTFNKGMLMFHAFHEIDNNSSYMKKKSVNSELFLKKIKAFASVGEEPAVLPMKERGRTLCFSSTNPFIFNRKTAPFFGELIVEDEKTFNELTIVYYIFEQKIDRVLFHNPYANEHRLAIFEAIKEKNIPYVIAERGALRDSVFFDDTGFNSDSKRYDYNFWDENLSTDKINYVKKYILQEKSIDASLENQPPKIGTVALRKKLKLSKSKKVIFVPLQRPSDTVIKFFTKNIGGYDEFLCSIARAAEIVKRDYVFVLKRHPLELDTPRINGVLYADDVNVKDLLDLSSKVYLINSGVGILGLMYDKHVIVAGEAFYDSEKLVSKAYTVEELVRCIYAGDPASTCNKIQFINYLISDFYSFGKFETRTIPWPEGGMMTVTSKIDFYQINIPNLAKANYLSDREVFKKTSILFDRYRESADQNKSVIPVSPVAVPPKLAAVSTKSVAVPTKPVAVPAKPVAVPAKLVVVRETVSDIEGARKKNWKNKMAKLKNNPRNFYNDSSNGVVRWIGSLLGYVGK